MSTMQTMTQPTSNIENQIVIGQTAPDFILPSVQGDLISLANYRQKRRVILWFSRGFSCNFCRGYMDGIIAHYEALQQHEIEVIQVAPNLLEAAQTYFETPPPYPFVCDPDKRLYAVYGLGDRGVLEAARNTIVSFSTAFTQGEGLENVRASWIDVANRNFLTRLHHHALTAVDQGLFIIDKTGVIRYRLQIRALESIPAGHELLALTQKAVTR